MKGSDLNLDSMVKAGHVIAEVAGTPIKAEISGIIRGLIRNGLKVKEGLKLLI